MSVKVGNDKNLVGLRNNTFPENFFMRAFSSLGSKYIPLTAKACRSWKQMSIETAKAREISRIRKFAKFLNGDNNVPVVEFVDRGLLTHFLHSNNDSMSFTMLSDGLQKDVLTGLVKIKQDSDVFKDVFGKYFTDSSIFSIPFLLRLIKDHPDKLAFNTSETDQTKLELYWSVFQALRWNVYRFEDVLDLIVHGDMEDTSGMIEVGFSHFSIQLARYGLVTYAIEMASLISKGYFKDQALEHIAVAIMRRGDERKALEVANQISLVYYKDQAFIGIALEIMERGDETRAREVVNLRPEYDDSEDNRRVSALQERFIKIIIEEENLDRVVKAANALLDDSTKSKVFHILSRRLTERRKEDKAVELANLIPCATEKSRAFEDISKTLMELDDEDGALMAARLIPDHYKRSKALLKLGDGYGALVAANLILCDIQKSSAFEDISKALMRQNEEDEAIVVACLIPCDYEKSEVLKNISEKLMGRGDKDRAIEVASLIPWDYKKSEVFNSFSRIFKAEGDEDRVREIEGLKPPVRHRILDMWRNMYTMRIERQDKDSAIKLVSSFSCTFLQGEILCMLSAKLLEQEDEDRALKAAMLIRNKYIKAASLLVIAEKKTGKRG